MITEPTRDEINRALAEWEGWKGCCEGLGVPPGGGKWGDRYPNYVESLDAQLPLWERAGVTDAEFTRPYNDETPYGLWRADLQTLFQGEFLPYVNGEGQDIPEAAARALYAVLEATK